MTKKILAIIGLVGAGAMSNHVSAQPALPIVNPACSLDLNELGKAPKEDELLAQQTGLTNKKMALVNSLTKHEKTLAGASDKDRPALEATIAALKDRIELNRIALSYVQEALAFYAKRQDNLAACESALKRMALVDRIAAPETSAADRQVLLKAEAATVTAKLDAAKQANKDLIRVGPSAMAYARFSLEDVQVGPDPDRAPSRQADAGTLEGDPCQYMIGEPLVTLRVGECGGAARIRSARSLAGGDVAFPSSVLRPRGITANLAGGSSDGTVSINYADSFKFRRTPTNLPKNPEDRVQLPWEFGYSFGVTAKDGLIFTRDDPDTSIEDNLDGKATVKAGLFFNVFEGETLRGWEARAAKLKDAAIKACRKDQASGESKTPSTCAGQSLTDWVYHVNGESGALLRPELAKQADALYFRSEDDKPVWGGGVNFSLSRSNFDHLDPAIFIADPASKNQSDGGWNHTTTAFIYRRLNPKSWKVDLSTIPSVSYGSRFGYDDGTKTRQFCPALTAGTPFVTGACPSYYTTAPRRIESWTPAIEVRLLTPRSGRIPSFGVSPKFSYELINGSTADRQRLAIPALAFVDKEAGLGVGLEYSHEWGGLSDTANADGTFDKVPDEDSLKIVVTKTFSLTGN